MSVATATATAPLSSRERLFAHTAVNGLLRPTHEKFLPPWLFYDDEGSRLFEAITELPEYYLTRAERSIFVHHADAIIEAAVGAASPMAPVVELGAGTAKKSQILLAALARRHGRARYVPVDVSAAALDVMGQRLRRELPAIEVTPLVMHHEEALARLKDQKPSLVMFIGSSIGNSDDVEAVALLSKVRTALPPRGALLLGADRKKSVPLLLAAYDDKAGVTARFNLRALQHLNAVLDAGFDVGRFRHVALWNEARSRIEMHLESVGRQQVCLGKAGVSVDFADGERIHTESSHKYSDEKIAGLLTASGFRLEQTWNDDDGLFGVHLARVDALEM
jgi:L-histidine Nalpha-methyltransferase